MKIIRLNIGLTLLALGLGACHNSSSPSMLDRIDSLTYTCPAMALKKLDSIEASSGTLSKDDKMMCSMLRVKAKFKAYQPIGKDSQIVQVAEYYDQNGTAHQRMNVHYLLGNYYMQRGDAPRALDSFLKAIEYADTINEPHSLMLIHGMMQDLYENLYLYEEARKEMERAVYYAMRCRDTTSALIYKGNIPWFYSMTNQYDSADVSAQRLYKEWQKTKDGENNSMVLSYSIKALLEKREWSKAKTYLDIYEQNFTTPNVNSIGLTHLLYDLKARYYIGVGQGDSALHYIRLQQKANGSFANKAWYCCNYMNLYRQQGKLDSVSKYAELYCNYSDSSFVDLNVEHLLQIKGMYNYNRQQEEIYRQQIAKTRMQYGLITVGGLLISIIICCFYVIKRNKQRLKEEMLRQNERYDHLIEQYRLMTEQYESLKDNDIRRNQKAGEVKQAISKMLKGGKTPTAQVVNHPWVILMHRKAKNDKLPSKNEWDEMENALSTLDAHFLEWLVGVETYISCKEYRLCVLTRLGFIPTEMAMLLATSRSNITNIRSRLMMKLFGVDGSATDFDRRIANI